MWRELLDKRFTRALRTCFDRLWNDPASPALTQRKRRPLVFERLEPRLLMSADLAEGLLHITGTDGDDTVLLEQIEAPTGAPLLRVTLNRETFEFDLASVDRISAELLDGGDSLTVDSLLFVPLMADGGAGDDFIISGFGNDTIRGGAGSDFLDGGDGDDTLDGHGNDLLIDGFGNDTMVGGAGNDFIIDGFGNDTMLGGDGNDTLVSGFGNDIMLGGAGNDEVIITTGPAADLIAVRPAVQPGPIQILVTDIATGASTASLEVMEAEAITVNAGADDEFSLDNSGGGLEGVSFGFHFDTVFTTKIDWSGPGDEGPEESITFVYGKLGVLQFEDGGLADRFDVSPGPVQIQPGPVQIDVANIATGRTGFHAEATGLASLTVNGGDGDDEFNVTGTVAETLNLFGNGGDDSFEIKDFPIGVENPTTIDWLFDLGDGSNFFTANLENPAGLLRVVAGGEEISLGQHDRVKVNFVWDRQNASPFELVQDLGEGNDQITLDLSASGVEPCVSVAIDTGDGNDAVTLNATGEFEELLASIATGAGDDQVSLGFVLNASGNIETNDVNSELMDIDTGDGNDAVVFNAEGSFEELSASIATGQGDDAVNINHIISPRDPASGQVGSFSDIFTEVDLGAGDDSINANSLIEEEGIFYTFAHDSGDGHDMVVLSVSNPVPAEGGEEQEQPGETSSRVAASLRTGDGDDRVQVDVAGQFSDLDLDVDTGAGNDSIRHKLFAIVDRTNMTVQTGDGNDLAEWEHQYEFRPGKFTQTDYNFELGDGDDTFNAVLVDPKDGLSGMFDLGISGGGGNDLIGLLVPAVQKVRAAVSIDGGAGNDAINAVLQTPPSPVAPAAGIELDISGGIGSDSIALLVPAVQKVREAAARIHIDGGDGADALSVGTGDAVEAVDAFFKSVGGLESETEVVEYEAGISDLLSHEQVAQIDMAHLETFTLETGGGADQILIGLNNPSAPLPALNFSTGDGDDTVDASFVSVAGDITFSLDTGAGNDTVDVNVSEADDIITGSGPEAAHVKVFDGITGAETFSFLPYGGFTGGVRVAAGDVNGDGTDDIITGAGPGALSHVKVFDGRTGSELRSFFAYGSEFAGGVFVAAGDVNGDGMDDIITGTDAGALSHVKVFDGAIGTEIQSFIAYGASFAGGVRVAAGDVNGDGFSDIITGSGLGAPAHVKVFDGRSLAEIRSFLAYGTFTGGVFVAAGDVNGDGMDDIITGTDAGALSHVKVFDGAIGTEIQSFIAYGASFAGGVRVAAGDVNGDGRADIITGAGPGAAPHVKVFDGASGAELRSFFAYNPSFPGGVYVASGDVSGSAQPTALTLTLDGGGGNDRITIEGSGDNSIAGGDGDDVVTVKGNGRNEIVGGAGNDRITIEGSGDETIAGGDGDDVITVAGSGHNEIVGGDGNDLIGLLLPAVQKVREAAVRVDGGAGNDVINVELVSPVNPDPSGAGIDLDITGGAGNDAIALLVPAVQKAREAAARINLDGGAGNDLFGGAFNDGFAGNLGLSGFETATMQVNGDFDGSLTVNAPGVLQQLAVTGTVTAPSTITATNLSNVSIGTLAGSFTAVEDSTPGSGVMSNTTIGSITSTGTVSTGAISGMTVGSMDGVVTATNTLDLFTAGTVSGTASAGRIIGNVDVQGELSGTIQTTRGDFGRVLTDAAGMITGVTALHVGGMSETGKIISAGDLVSAVDVEFGMNGVIAVQGNLGVIQTDASGNAVVDASNRLMRFGGLDVSGGLDGAVVVVGNFYGDLGITGGLGGRIAVDGQAVQGLVPDRFGILGNIDIRGGIQEIGAIVSGGVIGDDDAGTFLDVSGKIRGMLAAGGDINFGSVGKLNQADVIENAAGSDQAAIDAIFTDNGLVLLVTNDSDLEKILADLRALRVDKGKLTGTTA